MSCRNTTGADADTGDRPDPNGLSPCTPCWLSEDLRIDPGGTVYTVGQPVSIQARLRTKAGANFQNAHVRVWVCKSGVGLTPSHAIDLPPPGAPKYFEKPAFSTAAVPSGIPGLTDWFTVGPAAGFTPTPTGPTEGHYCLLAACWATGAGAQTDGAAVGDGATIFEPCCDAHLTQRNLSVAGVSGAGAKMAFHFVAGNPEPRRLKAVTIGVRHLHGPRLSEGVRVDRGLVHWLRRALRGGPYEKLPVRLSRYPLRNVEIQGVEPGGPLPITQKELVPLTLTADVPRGAPGSAHVLDVVERDLTGKVVGGLRLVVLVTPPRRSKG